MNGQPLSFYVDLFQCFSFEIVSILAGSGACGIACVLVNVPWLQTSLLTLLVTSGTASNVLNTATVGLYPTAYRYRLMSSLNFHQNNTK